MSAERLATDATSAQGAAALPGRVAPRPRTIEETGLSQFFLGDLICKHLRVAGTLDMEALSKRLALPGSVLEKVVAFLRTENLIEVQGAALTGGGLRFALTDRGRAHALEARERSGYVGPAPVPLELYERVATAQSIHNTTVTRQRMRGAFSGVVIKDAILDQLGPALHSGRAIFIYGGAGTGKTFICRRLANLLDGEVMIPYAIAVSETVVRMFDGTIHKPIDTSSISPSLLFDGGHDARFVMCERPVVTVGGELTSDLLDIQFDPAAGLFDAPLQLRANNGLFLLDDLGRQRTSATEVLNRWIVPLEERRDYLNIGGRLHFSVPFDLILVFSTNLNPLELADEAFLRRIGYKVRFDPLVPVEYRALWAQVSAQLEIQCASGVLDYLITELHEAKGVALLPCHPRDLAGLAMDYFNYEGQPRILDRQTIDWAWNSYFVNVV
ncbi:MAG: hypothetical protein ACI8PT_004638 [Gammaproteobacteria bacterium]|jgi:hypothetical protein